MGPLKWGLTIRGHSSWKSNVMVAHASDLHFNRCSISSADPNHKPSRDANTCQRSLTRQWFTFMCILPSAGGCGQSFFMGFPDVDWNLFPAEKTVHLTIRNKLVHLLFSSVDYSEHLQPYNPHMPRVILLLRQHYHFIHHLIHKNDAEIGKHTCTSESLSWHNSAVCKLASHSVE